MNDRFNTIEKEMRGTRRSIQYDLTKKTGTIMDVLGSAGTSIDELQVIRQTLAVTLPITEDATFVAFNADIRDSEEKRQALVIHILFVYIHSCMYIYTL